MTAVLRRRFETSRDVAPGPKPSANPARQGAGSPPSPKRCRASPRLRPIRRSCLPGWCASSNFRSSPSPACSSIPFMSHPTGSPPVYYVAIALVAALAIVVFQALDINQVNAFRAPVQQGLRLVGGWTLVFLAALAAVFFLKLEGVFSRVWLARLVLVRPRRAVGRARCALGPRATA